MEPENKNKSIQTAASLVMILWFAGWLYTIVSANLVRWKIVLGIICWIVWPSVRGLVLR